MKNVVKLWNLGRVCYDHMDMIQRHISALHSIHDRCVTVEDWIKSRDIKIHNTLLLIEHEPVYTAGPRSEISPAEQAHLESLGAHFRRTDRGGLVAFHGPGQLTAFPVLNLRHFTSSVKWIVNCLEETAMDTCGKYGIKTARTSDVGVWVEDRKICALGVHVSRGITTHGLALNCCTDLSWFKHIVPCGIVGKGITSISKELGELKTVNNVIPVFTKSFEDVFDCQLVEMTKDEKKSILYNIIMR